MDRRESLKALALGSLAASTLIACEQKKPSAKESLTLNKEKYGRTPEEAERDAALMKDKFFTDKEMATITALSDIIIPADEHSGSASQAKVPDFIEFMAKDNPRYQIPLRGGLKWLDVQSLKMFNKSFTESSKDQQLQLVDLIAYPEKAKPEMQPGVSFFSTMRNLTATGFFTSKMGIEDLGYKGNNPNQWDGVPADVLKQYGLEYDAKTLAVCLKNEDRGKMMVWPENV